MCINHHYRSQVLDKIRGVILMGDSEDEKYDHPLCVNHCFDGWGCKKSIYAALNSSMTLMVV
jgi:hypothetical protein